MVEEVLFVVKAVVELVHGEKAIFDLKSNKLTPAFS